ncbi:MAG: VTT domain-containing protein [Microgenomates group bacterium]
MLNQLIAYLQHLSLVLPLEIFCLVGSFIEEIIGPIPSPIILVTSGTIVFQRHGPELYLIVLAIIAASGKTFASWIIYYLSDKVEDLIFTKYGQVLGTVRREVDKMSAYFNGTWKDDFFLILFRAIPIFPTTAVSIASGFIKLDQKSFIRSTFIGFFIRSLFLLYLGYAGIESFGLLRSWLAE